MRPLIQWPGGQSHLAKRIVRYLPKHRVYVEPFAGGASVFFAKKPSPVEALGDRSKWAMTFYKKVRAGGLRACGTGISNTRESFKKAKRKTDACSLLARNILSYDGNMHDYSGLRREKPGFKRGQTKLKNLSEYERRLRGVKIKTADFAETMRKYDSVNTLHFLDPPWSELKYAKKHYGKGFIGSDGGLSMARVRKVAEKMKGKVMVLYNESPGVAKEFCRRGWKCYRMRTHRSASIHGRVKTSRILAVRNFRIK
jgi:DNA adenine methylase